MFWPDHCKSAGSGSDADGNRKGALIILKATELNCFHLYRVCLNDVIILIMASWYFTEADILWHQLSPVKFRILGSLYLAMID